VVQAAPPTLTLGARPVAPVLLDPNQAIQLAYDQLPVYQTLHNTLNAGLSPFDMAMASHYFYSTFLNKQ